MRQHKPFILRLYRSVG